MGRLIEMERKWYGSSIIDHDIDFIVTMAGCVDVPDSDRGDIRRRRAVDISSFNNGFTKPHLKFGLRGNYTPQNDMGCNQSSLC